MIIHDNKSSILMKYLLIPLFLIGMKTALAQSVKDEKEAIAHTVQFYFDGMMERDRSKLEEAFHPEARLIGYRGENFTITSFEDWANGTSKGEKRDLEQHTNKLLKIDLKGYTALANTELFWSGIYYFDYLTLIKIDGQWKIVHKTWYEENR